MGTSTSAPLHKATTLGRLSDIKAIVRESESGRPYPYVNAPDEYGRTALLLAVQNKHLSVATFLADHPTVDLNCQDAHGQTVLMAAVACGEECAPLIKKLSVKKEVDVNLRSHLVDADLEFVPSVYGPSFHLAKHNKKNQQVVRLQPHHSVGGQTALHMACRLHAVEYVEALLRFPNVATNLRDANGQTALDVCGNNCPKQIKTAFATHSRIPSAVPTSSSR